MNISKMNYGKYSSDNYGYHTIRITIGDIDLYFSYDTVVAFNTPATGLKVRQNDWSTTTGKHLNWIDNGNKRERLSSDEFVCLLTETLNKRQIVV